MTQEEKQLLLKDLCARLPYGVRVKMEAQTNPYSRVEFTLLPKHDGGIGRLQIWLETGDRYLVQPYLRPMSSMTEEEKEELKQEHIKDEKLYAECLTKAANGDNSMRGKVIPHFATDWCNKNHFDYRGLIPMGLALEASKSMYSK